MKEFNEIQQLFKKLSNDEKKKILLQAIGKEAVEWFEYKQAKTPKRIVDPASGRWVSEFKANGVTYYIRTPEQGLSLYRFSKLKQWLSIVGFNATYSEQRGSLNRMISYANTLVTPKPQLNALFAEIENMRKAIEDSNRNWDYSLTTATLFIVTKDEDLSTWDENEAETKIDNWNKAGLLPQDFFLLTIGWAAKLQEQSKGLLEKISLQVKRSISTVG